MTDSNSECMNEMTEDHLKYLDDVERRIYMEMTNESK